MTTTFVAMNHRGPIATALTVEAAQREAVRTARQRFGASEYDYFWVGSKPFVTRPGECVLMRKPKGKRALPAESTSYKVVEVALIPDEATEVDSPFPVRVSATTSGAELDVSSFLIKAVFAEMIAKADDDPKALVQEFADMADLLRSAVGQGRDSHARHAFDEKMQGFVKEFADDGVIPVYGDAVRRMADRLAQIAAPRPAPGQREAGAA